MDGVRSGHYADIHSVKGSDEDAALAGSRFIFDSDITGRVRFSRGKRGRRKRSAASLGQNVVA